MQNKAPSWVKVSLIGLLSLLLIVTAAPLTAAAQTPAPTPTPSAIPVEKIEIYFYWSNTCPHCLEAKPFLEELASRDPRIQLYQYEIHEGQNSDLYKQKALEYGFTPEYVPGIFIGEKYWVGFDENIRSQIEAHICQQIDCEAPQPVNGEIIDIPIIGKVDLTGKSLLLSTILIGFVDGVNPCSIWVLTMLLSLTLHTGSRRKVLIIGLVFLSVTALVYALFIAGLFSVLTFVSFVGWIQVVVALVALFFAIINIKDYFWYKAHAQGIGCQPIILGFAWRYRRPRRRSFAGGILLHGGFPGVVDKHPLRPKGGRGHLPAAAPGLYGHLPVG
jgi:glutaredoxin